MKTELHPQQDFMKWTNSKLLTEVGKLMQQGSCRGPRPGADVTPEELQEGWLTALQAVAPLHTPSTGVGMRYVSG